MGDVTSSAVDPVVDKYSQPVLNTENALKIALFGINLRGGVTLADVEGKAEGTWEENLRLAQHADRLGLDAVIPIARWRGYGGEGNLGDRSFETFTWATGLLASTRRIQVFATFHVPVAHPGASREDGRDGGPRLRRAVRTQYRCGLVSGGVLDVRADPERSR